MYSSQDMHKTFSILRACGDGDPSKKDVRRKTLSLFPKTKATVTIPKIVSLTEVGFPEKNRVTSER